MNIQINNYGACIRLTTDSSVLMLAKTQVKSIEVIRQDTVKISLGDGPLHEILIKLTDVTQPAGLVDVAALRDAITQMLDTSNGYEVEALFRQQVQIDELIAIKQLFNLLNGSIQIDLNFQQLEVNALVSISNRLLEAKDNAEKLLHEAEEQTGEIKAQSLHIVAMDAILGEIKAASEKLLIKQDAQLNMITEGNTKLQNIQLSGDKLFHEAQEQTVEIKAQSQLISGLSGLLSLIKTASENLLIKQDALYNIIGETKAIIVLTQNSTTAVLDELKVHTKKLTSIDTTLCDIKAQNTVSQSKQDAQTKLLGDIKTVLSQR